MLWVLPYWNISLVGSFFGGFVGNKGGFGFVWHPRFLGPTIRSDANWVRLVKDSLQMKQLLGSFRWQEFFRMEWKGALTRKAVRVGEQASSC